MRADVTPIWAATEIVHAKGRSITGDAELLLGLEAIAKLYSELDHKRTNLHVGQGEWMATVSHNENRRGYPDGARSYEIRKIFHEMGSRVI